MPDPCMAGDEAICNTDTHAARRDARRRHHAHGNRARPDVGSQSGQPIDRDPREGEGLACAALGELEQDPGLSAH